MNHKPKQLVVLLDGRVIGDLRQDPHGQLSFEYREQWRSDATATPLSLSMPLSRSRYGNAVVDAWSRGLLPDSESVLQRWGARFGVLANSPFALLSHVGEDVAGAAQFVRPDRLTEVNGHGGLEWVDEAYVADRLRILRGDRAAWDDASSPGQFSLAGAQSKFALYRSPEGQWAIPYGSTPTTHIVKPALPHLANQEVNEHLCLRAAARLGMRTAHSRVLAFGDERAIVLERYDRLLSADGNVRRIHQEDLCQALGVQPARKYEREDGGPGAVRIVTQVFRRYQDAVGAAASTEHFVRALAFNWIVFGPDAHAKNYSVLLSGRRVFLAPLYDVSSVAGYSDRYDLRTMTMAMSVNGKYQNTLITEEDWAALAREMSVNPPTLLGWVRDVVEHVNGAFTEVIAEQEPWVREQETTESLQAGVERSATFTARFL